ncbi:hypothetical protein ABFT23_07800 [Nocardioides sp. C4-1]|uniref:hypothetical protein n=1 Tax=Nocardioides sp. C4-1 TaxID=3151851 RepID=UPI0032659153
MEELRTSRRGLRRRLGERGVATFGYLGAVSAAVLLALGVTSQYPSAADRLARSFVCAVESVVHFPDGDLCADDGPGTPGGPDDPQQPPLDPDNPENPGCVEANPSSGELDQDAETLVQVGCVELYVPRGCEEEWAAYLAAEVGPDREDAAGPLGECVRDVYDSIETPCVVSSTSEVDKTEMQILFIKVSASDALVIEKLGDGRVRAHLLRGTETGAGVSGSLGNVSFGFGAVSGYETDKTYEFENVQSAQSWIDWYRDLRHQTEIIADNRPNQVCGNHCPVNTFGWAAVKEAMARIEELQGEEPPHHILADATTTKTSFKIEGGLSFPTPVGGSSGGSSGGVQPTAGPTFEGSYTGELQVEDRRWSDGTQTISYKSSDAGGLLLGLQLGGTGLGKPKGDGTQDDVGSGSIGAGLGGEWEGSTTTTAVWDPEGELSKVIVTLDDKVMRTLAEKGIDIGAVLPRGFGASFAQTSQEAGGSSAVTEMILDLEQHPELRGVLTPVVDRLFPRDDEGDLQGGELDLSPVSLEDQQALAQAIDDNANVRRLDYGVTEQQAVTELGVDLGGVDLFKATWTSIETATDLNGSSFEVIDVNGDTQTLDPAPKCDAPPFVAPEDYWEHGWSDPPTPHPLTPAW